MRFDEVLYYVIIAIILLFLLTIVYMKFTKTDEYKIIKNKKIEEAIEWLYEAVNAVCYRCNLSPLYKIIDTSKITYTEKIKNSTKGEIYLLIWNEKTENVFNYNTLLYYTLHEIAHILSPSKHHEPPFHAIEKLLIDASIALGYYDPKTNLDDNYITLDLTE